MHVRCKTRSLTLDLRDGRSYRTLKKMYKFDTPIRVQFTHVVSGTLPIWRCLSLHWFRYRFVSFCSSFVAPNFFFRLAKKDSKMSEMINLCEKLFQTRNLYEIFKVEKNSSVTSIKESYNRLALEIHPDKVEEEMVKTATEKFQLMQSIFNVIMDKNKRKMYDERGIVSNITATKMEPLYISDDQLNACTDQYASKKKFFIAKYFPSYY